jgi:predicted Zn-dependent peptidase
MALESPSARAGQLARQQILWGRPIPLEETVARIEKIDAERVRQVAGKLFSAATPALAGIGPVKALPDYAAIAAHLNG